MKSEWKTIRINEAVSFVVDNRGKTPPTQDEGYGLLEVNAISATNKYPQYQNIRKYVSPNIYNTWFRNGHPQIGDTLVPTVGTLGAVSYMNRNDCCIAQNIVALRPDTSVCDNNFLYYVLCNPANKKRLLNLNIGGVQPSIKVPHLMDMEIAIPVIDIQKKIAKMLSILDDKIDLNQRINDNLQRQAQAIYAAMFLGCDGTAGVLSDIATITMGQSPKGSSYNENGVGEVFYQGRAEFGDRFPTRRLFTTEPKRIAEPNDVLLSVRAPVGDLNVAYERCCIGRGLGAIHSKSGHNSYLLYTMLALRPKLDVFNGEGTVFGSINRDTLSLLPITIPATVKIDEFETVVRPMDDLIRANYEEICRLRLLRDSLLPRLMSGEIDLQEA